MSERPGGRELEHRIELQKEDVKIMEVDINGTLKSLRHEVRAEIEQAKNTQTRWTIGVGLSLAALILGVAVYLG